LEHPLRDALLIGLDDLSTEHLVELLVEYGASAELAEQLGGRLRTLTRGEPLFARFVCHDVARGGEQALATLERESPQGVRDYFSWQLLQLKSRASRDGNVAWSLLELLVAARGGMTPQELADVLDVPSHVVDSTLKPLRRFLQGAPRVTLMHHEFRNAIIDELSPKQQRRARKQLLDWCSECEQVARGGDIPDYVLDHYVGHLYSAGEYKGLYELLSPHWMQLKLARSGGRLALAQDLLLAIRAAREQVPPDLVEEFRSSLILASIGTIGRQPPLEVFRVLAKVGLVSQAEAYVALVAEPSKRIEAVIHVAQGLLESGDIEKASRLAQEALAGIKLGPENPNRMQSLVQIADMLAQLGLPERAVMLIERALEISRELPKGTKEPSTLADAASVVGRLGNRRLLEELATEVLRATEQLPKNRQTARPLVRTAGALAQIGHTVLAADVAERALNVLPVGRMRKVRIPEILADLANNGNLEFALRAAETELAQESRSLTLAEIACTLARSGQIVRAQHLIEAASGLIGGNGSTYIHEQALLALARAHVAVDNSARALQVAEKVRLGLSGEIWGANVARLFAEVVEVAGAVEDVGQGRKVIERTLATVDGISDEIVKARSLAEIAEALVGSRYIEMASRVGEEAFSILRTLPKSRHKERALGKIAGVLSRVGNGQYAIEAIELISSRDARTAALVQGAEPLARAGNSQVLLQIAEQLFQSAQAEIGHLGKAHALVSLAETLDGKGFDEVVGKLAREGLNLAQALPNNRDNRSRHYLARRAMEILSTLDEQSDVDGQSSSRDHEVWSGNREFNHIKWLLSTGRVNKAWKLTQRLSGTTKSMVGLKATAYCEVAWAAAQQGRVEIANSCATDALSIIQSLPDDDEEKARTLAVLAGAYFRIGEVERAAKAGMEGYQVALRAAGRQKARKQAWTFARAAGGLGNAGLLDDAGRVAEHALDVSKDLSAPERAYEWAGIARMLGRIGQPQLGSYVADRAFRIASSLPLSDDQMEALAFIAEAIGTSGRDVKVEEVVELLARAVHAVPIDVRSVPSFIGAAEALIESGQVKAGLSVVEQVLDVRLLNPQVPNEAHLLAELATVFCRAGHTGRATSLVQQLLTTARLSGRQAVFSILRAAIGTMACLGGHELLVGIANAILDVEQWWDDPGLASVRTRPA
jgi:tetratricopeptide (TPR) repeat protein